MHLRETNESSITNDTEVGLPQQKLGRSRNGTPVNGSIGGLLCRCTLISEENSGGNWVIHSILLSTRIVNVSESTGLRFDIAATWRSEDKMT